MKKLIILSLFAFVAFAVNAQIGKGVVYTKSAATLDGNNNRTLAEIDLSRTYEGLAIKVAVARVSTAAGGTLYLKAGIDSTSALVVNQSTNPSIEFQPNDTLVTTDVATQYWIIRDIDPAFKYYAIFGDGDVNDTLTVTTSYIYK